MAIETQNIQTFFTSKDAAKITGCTLRQLQYWREKEVIVPAVSATGTGRSVYYSYADLFELKDFERESAVSFAVPSATLFWIKVCRLFLCGWIGFMRI